jgi:hypothetical protein
MSPKLSVIKTRKAFIYLKKYFCGYYPVKYCPVFSDAAAPGEGILSCVKRFFNELWKI